MILYIPAGRFNASEIFAWAILNLNNICTQVKREKLTKWSHLDGVKISLGGEWQPEIGEFNHQRTYLRKNGIPYSVAGMVWSHYGKELIRKQHKGSNEVKKIWEFIDKSLIQKVDMFTHGYLNGNSLSKQLKILEALNITVMEDTTGQDLRFQDAGDIAKNILMEKIQGWKNYPILVNNDSSENLHNNRLV